MPLTLRLPNARNLPPSPEDPPPQLSACSRELIQERLSRGMTQGRALWQLAHTHSGKPWRGSLKKEAKGQV